MQSSVLLTVLLRNVFRVYTSCKCSVLLPHFWCDFRYQNFSLWPLRVLCASWETRDNSSLRLWENRASASCSSCRTCICTFLLCASFIVSCQSTDKILPRSRFVLTSGSKKCSFLMKQSTLRRFALIIQGFSCLLCNQMNSFYCDTVIAKDLFRSETVSDENWNITHEVALSLWERYHRRIVWRNICTRSKLLHPNCSEDPVLPEDLFEQFEPQLIDFQSLPQDLWWDSVAQLMLSYAQHRCVIREWLAGLLVSWVRERDLNDFLIIEPQIVTLYFS